MVNGIGHLSQMQYHAAVFYLGEFQFLAAVEFTRAFYFQIHGHEYVGP